MNDIFEKLKSVFKKDADGIKNVKSTLFLKHGTYNIAIIAVAIAAVIVLNVLATVISDRLPMQLDLSSEKEMSLSKDNVDFIESIDKEVNVVICASREGYIGGMLSQMAQIYYSVQDENDTKYYTQAVSLLESYEKYNKNIKVRFADPNKSSFAEVQKIADGLSLSYGDILVYAKDGAEGYRTRAVTYNDIYSLYDESGYAAYGYGGYTINACKIETAVTSAIYAVTSNKTFKVDLVTGHSTVADFSQFSKDLSLNGYEVNEIKSDILSELSEDADVVVVAAPTSDFAESEIDVLERFLENGGKRGKTLAVMCSCAGSDAPNFYGFLNEWGISCDPSAKLFETDEDNYITGDPTTMGFTNAKSAYTEGINNTDALYISGANVPLTAAYSTYGSRTTTVILQSSNTVVAAPLSAEPDWTPDSEYEKKSYAGAIVTSDIALDNEGNQAASYVIAYSGLEFCSGGWNAYGEVGNTKFVLASFSSVCGKEDAGVSFVDKTVTEYAFTKPADSTAAAIRFVFVIVLPALLVLIGFLVWNRRRKR